MANVALDNCSVLIMRLHRYLCHLYRHVVHYGMCNTFATGFFIMENGDTAETGLSESYLAQSYAAMEGKYVVLITVKPKIFFTTSAESRK